MTNLKNKPYITYSLIALNVGVFVVMALRGGTTNFNNLIRFGAKLNFLINQGQWWRLFTAMFIHIGFEHLVLNMVTLYFIGWQTEMLFGHWRYLVIYLLSGVGGNIASYAFNPHSLSAGASTAIFGLFGAFLMLGETYRHNQYIRHLARQFLLFVVINIAFNLFGAVDLAGHLGGLGAGFLTAYIVGAPQLGKTNRKKQIISLSALLVIYGIFLKIGMAT